MRRDPEADFGDIYRRFGERVKDGVPEALDVFEVAAGHLAAAVVDLVTTLDLERVILAGPGFAELGEEYRRTIDQRLTESAFVRDVHPTTVRLAAGGVDASALGGVRNLAPLPHPPPLGALILLRRQAARQQGRLMSWSKTILGTHRVHRRPNYSQQAHHCSMVKLPSESHVRADIGALKRPAHCPLKAD